MAVQFLTTEDRFELGSRTLAGRYYTTPEVFALEQERIFYSSWICVGRADQIPNPGDYFLRQVGQESLILVRAQPGELNAFYNLCRHRGTRLGTQESGKFTAT